MSGRICWLMGLTLGLTVFLDLTTAVAIGLIAAGMVGAWHLEWLELDRVVSVPLLDRWFLPGHEGIAGSFVSRVGLVAFNGEFFGGVGEQDGECGRGRTFGSMRW